MKKILALAVVLVSPQASAFYDNNGSYSSVYGSNGEMYGNADGEGEATFSMNFKAKTRQSRNVNMTGSSAGNMNNYYGYDQPTYFGRMPAR